MESEIQFTHVPARYQNFGTLSFGGRVPRRYKPHVPSEPRVSRTPRGNSRFITKTIFRASKIPLHTILQHLHFYLSTTTRINTHLSNWLILFWSRITSTSIVSYSCFTLAGTYRPPPPPPLLFITTIIASPQQQRHIGGVTTTRTVRQHWRAALPARAPLPTRACIYVTDSEGERERERDAIKTCSIRENDPYMYIYAEYET